MNYQYTDRETGMNSLGISKEICSIDRSEFLSKIGNSDVAIMKREKKRLLSEF